MSKKTLQRRITRRAALNGAGQLMMGQLMMGGLIGGRLIGGGVLAGLPLAGMGSARAQSLPKQGLPKQGLSEWAAVSGLIGKYVDTRKVANIVAALGSNGDAPLFIARGNDSFTSGRLADEDSIYRIYSMTKPITGMAVMMLVDEGRIALDQPIADILPAFAEMQVQKEYDGPLDASNLEPAVRPMTIRHCLTHTAGLGYGIVQDGPLAEAYRRRGLVPGQVSRAETAGLLRGDAARSLEEFADRLAEMPLVYQPGTRWSYSVGLDLLGRVIEVVSGEDFASFLEERIFAPCGMGDTGFRVPADKAGRLTANYIRAGGRMVPIDLAETSIYLDEPPFPFGGAGLVSTPRDYDRFLLMLAGYGKIDGRRVMSEAAIRLGTSDLLPETLDPDDGFARDSGFGAGGRVGKGAEAGIYGWSGAAGTYGLVDMRSGLRYSLFTQYMPPEIYPLHEEFAEAVAEDVARMSGG